MKASAGYGSARARALPERADGASSALSGPYTRDARGTTMLTCPRDPEVSSDISEETGIPVK